MLAAASRLAKFISSIPLIVLRYFAGRHWLTPVVNRRFLPLGGQTKPILQNSHLGCPARTPNAFSRSARKPCAGIADIAVPQQGLVVKTMRQGWLDHLEVRRHVEVTRHKQAVVAHMQYLVLAQGA